MIEKTRSKITNRHGHNYANVAVGRNINREDIHSNIEYVIEDKWDNVIVCSQQLGELYEAGMYLKLVPLKKFKENMNGPMADGNVADVWGMKIPVHNRYETPAEYEFYSK
jgi:hypothetical protein